MYFRLIIVQRVISLWKLQQAIRIDRLAREAERRQRGSRRVEVGFILRVVGRVQRTRGSIHDAYLSSGAFWMSFTPRNEFTRRWPISPLPNSRKTGWLNCQSP